MSLTDRTDREDDLTPRRPGHHTVSHRGTYDVWDDSRQTYVLQWGPAAGDIGHGWQIADQADTVLMAMEAIRSTDDTPMDPALIASGLRDCRRLRAELAAIEDALILAARRPDAAGEPPLSWGRMAEEMHIGRSTVAARHDRLARGERAEQYAWLHGRGEQHPTTGDSVVGIVRDHPQDPR